MLTAEQVAFYHEHGYLRIPGVFTPEEMQAIDDDLMYLIDTWAERDQGWVGPWRQALMDEATEKKSQLIHLHDLQVFSSAWMQAVTNDRLCEAMVDLLGPDVELHHSTLHAKPPESGQPFPMHQDSAFYLHEDNRYVDVLVHLDDTCHANGEIRFLAASHKLGHLKHITESPDGEVSSPHLPLDEYRLEDTVAVPAERGDVVVFNIWTIHGSYVNTTDKTRRLVRVGYRHPDNVQVTGQGLGQRGLMVRGRRPRPAAVPAAEASLTEA